MRYLLALVFCSLSASASAADWMRLEWKDPLNDPLGYYTSYYDRQSVRQNSGHRLVWVQRTFTYYKAPEKQIPFFRDLVEFDCQGRFLTFKSMTRTDAEGRSFEEDKAGAEPSWKIIEPDSEAYEIEPTVCK